MAKRKGRMINQSISNETIITRKRRPLLKKTWELMQKFKSDGCVVCLRKNLEYIGHSNPLEIDHIVSLSRGGDNNIQNLQWLCRYHNRQKGRNPESEKYLFRVKISNTSFLEYA